jgi:hypothetical protein
VRLREWCTAVHFQAPLFCPVYVANSSGVLVAAAQQLRLQQALPPTVLFCLHASAVLTLCCSTFQHYIKCRMLMYGCWSCQMTLLS